MTIDRMAALLAQHVARHGKAPSAIRLTENQYSDFLGIMFGYNNFKDDFLRPGEAPRFCGVPVYSSANEMEYAE